ncbi:MAG: alpha-amylase [Porphyromonadaceae bacterium]|nr:alpha-amylase [Porphyromonadaceae bacterium]
MKKICLCFQIHQPYRFRRYRFFDIGSPYHDYQDDRLNQDIFEQIAHECYLPANQMMLELLRAYPDFRISYSISGLAIEQMEEYMPQLFTSFQELVATGRVELVAAPYAHSLASLYDFKEFKNQIRLQQERLHHLFGVAPSKVLCNTGLIYSDDIALMLREMGLKGVLTEGAKHVLGWKSPNYLYHAATNPDCKLLLRNAALSEYISKDFGRYDHPDFPITADKLISRVQALPNGEEHTVLYMNYETLGMAHRSESGIFDFFRALPMLAAQGAVGFATPSELVEGKSVGELKVSYPISSSGEEKSTHEWMGNILQQGAIEKLRELCERVHLIHDSRLLQDWLSLQSSDHFFYMSDQGSRGFSPYSSPYDAFNNYMNVLSDFMLRVDKLVPRDIDLPILNDYEQTISNQGEELKTLKRRIKELEGQLAEAKPNVPSAASQSTVAASTATPASKVAKSKTKADKVTEGSEAPQTKTTKAKRKSTAKSEKSKV